MRKLAWVTLTLCMASPVAAQTKTEDAPAAPAVAPAEIPVPTIAERIAPPASAKILFAEAPATDDAPIAMPMRRVSGRGTALAIVGGALFVGGLIAGGDAGTIMVISGAGIGAYGLYLMLTP